MGEFKTKSGVEECEECEGVEAVCRRGVEGDRQAATHKTSRKHENKIRTSQRQTREHERLLVCQHTFAQFVIVLNSLT